MNSFKWRKKMLKELISNRKQNRLNYSSSQRIFELRQRLDVIDKQYPIHHIQEGSQLKDSSQLEIPISVKYERDDILRQIDHYSKIIARKDDRVFYSFMIIFWSWFFRRKS